MWTVVAVAVTVLLALLINAALKSATVATVPRCRTCHHWWAMGGTKLGQCQRYPPNWREGFLWLSPVVEPMDVCGEWKEKP